MQIGEFVKLVKTTKDTVRHYEDFGLITPEWINSRREYKEKDILDFQVILELKLLGLSLRDIQLLFEVKKAVGCGDKRLIEGVVNQLETHLDILHKEETELSNRRKQLEDQIVQIKNILII